MRAAVIIYIIAISIHVLRMEDDFWAACDARIFISISIHVLRMEDDSEPKGDKK